MSYYDTWGPSARVVLKLYRSQMTVDYLENQAATAVEDFVAKPRSIMETSASMASHVVFFMRPTEDWSVHGAEIPTTHLMDLLVRASARCESAKRLEFFQTINTHRWFRSPQGYIFERFMHARLLMSSEPLDAKPVVPDDVTLTLPVRPPLISLSCLSDFGKANQLNLPFYWLPASCSFETTDAIICTEENILFIQSTISSKCNMKKIRGIRMVLETLPKKFRTNRTPCFIFVTDSEDRARRLGERCRKYNDDMPVYTCAFDAGKWDLSFEEKHFLHANEVSKSSCTLHCR
jgi:hypothetical protein